MTAHRRHDISDQSWLLN